MGTGASSIIPIAASHQMRSAVFLDRDGVINEDIGTWVKSWDEFTFLPGVFDALRRLNGTSHAVVVVSNQSGVGRGKVQAAAVDEVHRRMQAEISSRAGRLDAIYYCPHHPDDGCQCRKPRPGLLRQAADELNLDLTRCYLIGDAVRDIEAALEAGCLPILVLTGKGREESAHLKKPGFGGIDVVSNLSEAVELVINSRR